MTIQDIQNKLLTIEKDFYDMLVNNYYSKTDVNDKINTANGNAELCLEIVKNMEKKMDAFDTKIDTYITTVNELRLTINRLAYEKDDEANFG